MPMSSATATRVTPAGPCSINSLRAETSASSRASSGERRRRLRPRLALFPTTDTNVSSLGNITMRPHFKKCKRFGPAGRNSPRRHGERKEIFCAPIRPLLSPLSLCLCGESVERGSCRQSEEESRQEECCHLARRGAFALEHVLQRLADHGIAECHQ